MLKYLGHHPDIWFEAASFLQETAKILQVVTTYMIRYNKMH